jgi:Na+/proline symporter
MVHPLIRSVATGLLAGFSGAAFAAVTAGLLHLSMTIAGIVAGVALAVIVGVLTYRHRPGPVGPTQS